MYDLSKELKDFHEGNVRLTRDEQNSMRDRREANLKRIGDGLAELEKPALVETINQGGYRQRTMTQPPEADSESRYDIDLGVVFDANDALGPRTTRNWIRDAIARKAKGMKNDPETKKKCVRVVYAEGYQCDFPVFRRREANSNWVYELSCGDEWVSSDPEAMSKWIDEQVSAKSPEKSGSYQLRRIIRLLKYFAKVHAYRTNTKYPGGLLATAFAIECFVSAQDRDDLSLRETLRKLANRSKYTSVLANGIVISDANDTDRIERLINEAATAVGHLDTLNGDGLSQKDAAKAWKKVFRHSFFDDICAAEKDGWSNLETKSATLAAPALSLAALAGLSEQARAERMTDAVTARVNQGGGNKPWTVK